MARVIYRGFVKPDDPIYKEGWRIHIGPLLGTTPTWTTKPAAPQNTEEQEWGDTPRFPMVHPPSV